MGQGAVQNDTFEELSRRIQSRDWAPVRCVARLSPRFWLWCYFDKLERGRDIFGLMDGFLEDKQVWGEA